jgi:hypothetical protein
MNDPKDLIDGLFNSMTGGEPEAYQPETTKGPVCSEVFLAGTANEDGWCEDCEGNWPPEHQEPSDTVGAPILKTVAPDMRHGTAEAEVARDAEANRAAMDRLAVSGVVRDLHRCPGCGSVFLGTDVSDRGWCVECEEGDEPLVPEGEDEGAAWADLDMAADAADVRARLTQANETKFDALERKTEKLLHRIHDLESRMESVLSAFADGRLDR